MLITGSAFILGWYFVTRSGQLFGIWEEYWEGIVTHKKIYYDGENLQERLSFILKTNKALRTKLTMGEGGKSIYALNDLTYDEIFFINDTAALTEIKDKRIIFLYENDPVYRFPKWVRNPISACPPCQASVYGTIFWWTAVYFQNDMFSWTSHGSAKVVFWAYYCITLVFMNYFIHRVAKLK